MPLFQYTAKDKSAVTVNGEITADTQDEAIEKISAQGLVPVQVLEGTRPITSSTKGRVTPTRVVESSASASSLKVKGAVLYTFSRQLANLLKAGIPLLRGLEILENQLPGDDLKRIISMVILEVKNGRTFADALHIHPKTFSPLYVAMIRAGEESGKLREMLISLADYQKEQEEIRSKVRAAIAYPIIMGLLGVATIVFMLSYVMPRMSSLFENMEQLPAVTVILLQVSAFMKVAWLPVLLLLGVAAYLLRKWAESPSGRASLSVTVLTLPFWGKFIVKVQVARFARSMELLLNSGMSILQAIKLSVPMVDNTVIHAQLNKAYDGLVAGQSFGKSLKQADAIPSIIGDLVEVGEESGALGGTLQDIADEYEREINESIKMMTNLLEPLMIVVVGAVIGFIVMAMLLPIFQVDLYSR